MSYYTRSETAGLAIALGLIAVWLTVVGTIIYCAVHFVIKFW